MALTTENLQEALRDYQRAGSYAWSVGGVVLLCLAFAHGGDE